MRFTKPEWVMHQDGTRSENAKRLSMFSVHVHPDNSRIATGGLDAKVRIWSTKPILNKASEDSGRPPKSLCTLSMHTGPVLVVRWAHSGRWLASGSDDAVIMIWDLDPAGAGRVWGSDEVNVEGWKALKRLPGHESDVTDLAWSPEDRYLASTGLDSQVLIWCGYKLERLAKLDLHQGFVKGVCWDPVGEFLATQSDDRTVRIWRTSDWQLQETVTKPFEHSPGSTFFRRLSWSPDGAHITASNATNNNGFVFTAAVITRGSWTSDISLVGHENTVEVACYNPHIFLRDPSMPVVTANICSVVALGADDCSVSVWQTKSARPLIVAKEVFERQIMDLSWSSDGLTLYAVSSDGTLACFAFDCNELEGIAPQGAQKEYLRKFEFVPPPLPHGYVYVPPAQPVPIKVGERVNGDQGYTPPSTPPGDRGQSQGREGFGSRGVSLGPGCVNGNGVEQVTTLVARRAPKDRNKRRMQPTFVGSLGGESARGMDSVPSASVGGTAPMNSSYGYQGFSGGQNAPMGMDRVMGGERSIKIPAPPMQGFSTTAHGFDGMEVVNFSADFSYPTERDLERERDMDVPISAFDSKSSSGRRTRGDNVPISYSDNSVPKARTLGGDRIRGDGQREVREIRVQAMLPPPLAGGGMDLQGQTQILPPPSLKTFLEVRVEETGDTLEVRNSEDRSEPSEVTFFTSKEKTVQWLDYLPSPALSICASNRFAAVAMVDGSVNVYSLTGRRLMPMLSLGSPTSIIDACKWHLMVITSSAQVYIWNIKTCTAAHAPTSLLPHLSPSPPSPEYPNGLAPTLISASIRPNGAPIVQLENGVALSYDSSLLAWVKLSTDWWAIGSTAWKSRQRASSSAYSHPSSSDSSRGVIASIEARITDYVNTSGVHEGEAGKTRPAWWVPAMTLGHLEARMHAARILESPTEYKQAMLLYATTIANEGFRGKAEEVLKELYGPVYWRPGRTDDNWSPTVCCLTKRDLAKEVLAIFARSKTLFKLAQDYQDLLRKSVADD